MNNTEKKYWSIFYNKFNDLNPSKFAEFIESYLNTFNKQFRILDIGCGNGRDTYYLAKKHVVLGIDISNLPKDSDQARFQQENMVTFDKTNYDIIYSRFTFHSISDELQEKLIESIKPNTILCIETRSDKDRDIEKTYGDNHYRNYTNLNKITLLLKKNNFKIIHSSECRDVARYKSENPTCIRIICKN